MRNRGVAILRKQSEISIIKIPISSFGQEDRTFEYDPAKSATNLEKHGIDFEKAQELWRRRVVKVPVADDYGERRYAMLGMIDGKHWTAIVTFRGERIRIISARRSRVKEASYYDAEED